MKWKLGRGFKMAMAGLLLWAGVEGAQAAMTVYEDVGFLTTQLAHNTPESFSITTAGSYQARLVDFTFPESFKKLELSILGGSPVALHEVARLTGPGELIFDATPGSYWAAVFGQTGAVLGIGLYGIQIESLTAAVPTPVPLPAGVWLLGSVLGSLAVFYRRRPMMASMAA